MGQAEESLNQSSISELPDLNRVVDYTGHGQHLGYPTLLTEK